MISKVSNLDKNSLPKAVWFQVTRYKGGTRFIKPAS